MFLPFNMELREYYIFKQTLLFIFIVFQYFYEFPLALEDKLISVNN